MEFRQYKNGSCDIIFSWKERIILLKKGKLHLAPEAIKHFGNHLVKIVADWQINFNKDLEQQLTKVDTKINTK